ncbi:MAG: glycerophosphodiester phosphodiesterase [Candidatus Dojkabacteria bacterium]
MMNLISHRGVHNRKIKENTIEAIEAAFGNGFDSVEIDIRSTKDNILVLSHDADLQRVFGKGLKISSSRYDLLHSKCEGLATLHEVINKFPKKEILVEVKDRKSFRDLDEKLLPKTYRVQSFDWEGISKLAKTTKLTCGLLFPSYHLKLTSSFLLNRKWFWSQLKKNNIKFISIASFLISKKFILEAKIEGIELFVWTIRKKSQIEKYKELGIGNLITEVK